MRSSTSIANQRRCACWSCMINRVASRKRLWQSIDTLRLEVGERVSAACITRLPVNAVLTMPCTPAAVTACFITKQRSAHAVVKRLAFTRAIGA